MISLYILGTVLPSLIAGQCQVDLDALTGEFPPLLIQRGDFVFPSSRTEEDKRILTFEDGSPLDLYCHGSEKGQPSTSVTLGGVDTGDSKVPLTCLGGVSRGSCLRLQSVWRLPPVTRNRSLCYSGGKNNALLLVLMAGMMICLS